MTKLEIAFIAIWVLAGLVKYILWLRKHSEAMGADRHDPLDAFIVLIWCVGTGVLYIPFFLWILFHKKVLIPMIGTKA